MAGSRHWVVTASGELSPEELGALLERKGFAIEQRLGAIGVFTGHATDAVAQQLRGERGIADIVPDTPIDIGPPGAPFS